MHVLSSILDKNCYNLSSIEDKTASNGGNVYESRQYVESVYQKVLLEDIVARNNVRSPQALRILMKKIAETVCNEVSYSSLHGMLKGIGYSVSKDTIINYIELARESYLLFDTKNATAKFSEREGTPATTFRTTHC